MQKDEAKVSIEVSCSNCFHRCWEQFLKWILRGPNAAFKDAALYSNSQVVLCLPLCNGVQQNQGGCWPIAVTSEAAPFKAQQVMRSFVWNMFGHMSVFYAKKFPKHGRFYFQTEKTKNQVLLAIFGM